MAARNVQNGERNMERIVTIRSICFYDHPVKWIGVFCLKLARVFLFEQYFRPMAGGVFIGKAVLASVSFKIHLSLKAGFVLGVSDITFAGDDVSFFGLEKGADVMYGFAVVVVLTGQRLSILLSWVVKINCLRMRKIDIKFPVRTYIYPV